MAPKGKSNTEIVTSTKNIDVGIETDFNALIVELTGATLTATVDFQNSIDGSTYINMPYVELHDATPAKSIAQFSNPSTQTAYLLLPPLSQARIATTYTSGTLTVTYRVIKYTGELAG